MKHVTFPLVAATIAFAVPVHAQKEATDPQAEIGDEAGPNRTDPTPKSNPRKWIMPDDYPARADHEQRGGYVGFALNVGVNGEVLSCEVIESSGHSDLDTLTCELVQSRGQFNPALDANRNPIEGTFTGTVRWRPNREKLPEAVAVSFEFTIGIEGRVTSCKRTKAEGDIPERLDEEKTCTALSAQTFEPPLDQDGNPITKRVTYISIAEVQDEKPE